MNDFKKNNQHDGNNPSSENKDHNKPHQPMHPEKGHVQNEQGHNKGQGGHHNNNNKEHGNQNEHGHHNGGEMGPRSGYESDKNDSEFDRSSHDHGNKSR